VAEHGDLDVLGMLASQAPEEEVDKPACHKVEEGQSHRPIVAYRLLPAQRPGQVSEPYGLESRLIQPSCSQRRRRAPGSRKPVHSNGWLAAGSVSSRRNRFRSASSIGRSRTGSSGMGHHCAGRPTRRSCGSKPSITAARPLHSSEGPIRSVGATERQTWTPTSMEPDRGPCRVSWHGASGTADDGTGPWPMAASRSSTTPPMATCCDSSSW
jgi:hypothetical protein